MLGPNYISIQFINTCTIDYFLVLIATIANNNKYFQEKINNLEKKNEFTEVSKKISCEMFKNDWNSARYTWLQFNEFPIAKIFGNHYHYDFFSTEFLVFVGKLQKYQEYFWTSNCENPNCDIKDKLIRSQEITLR